MATNGAVVYGDGMVIRHTAADPDGGPVTYALAGLPPAGAAIVRIASILD